MQKIKSRQNPENKIKAESRKYNQGRIQKIKSRQNPENKTKAESRK